MKNLRRYFVAGLRMTVDEALRMIISPGVVVPTWRGEDMPELPLEIAPVTPAKKPPQD